MHILSTEPSSVILSQRKKFKKLINSDLEFFLLIIVAVKLFCLLFDIVAAEKILYVYLF